MQMQQVHSPAYKCVCLITQDYSPVMQKVGTWTRQTVSTKWIEPSDAAIVMNWASGMYKASFTQILRRRWAVLTKSSGHCDNCNTYSLSKFKRPS